MGSPPYMGLVRGSFPAPHHHDPHKMLPNFAFWVMVVCLTCPPCTSRFWRSCFCPSTHTRGTMTDSPDDVSHTGLAFVEGERMVEHAFILWRRHTNSFRRRVRLWFCMWLRRFMGTRIPGVRGHGRLEECKGPWSLWGLRGYTPHVFMGLMAGYAACCTHYIRHSPLLPVQRWSIELPATTVGEWRRRHFL